MVKKYNGKTSIEKIIEDAGNGESKEGAERIWQIFYQCLI